MAESSGGDSNWGVLEVSIVLILAITLLSNIGNKDKPYRPFEVNENQNQELVDSKNTNSCGLSISSPLSLQKVSTSVNLSGITSGCNWKNDGNTLLFAQIVNAGGVPISDYVSVQNISTNPTTNYFSTDIQIKTPSSGTGYLILVPAIQTEKPVTVKIPLKLSKN